MKRNEIEALLVKGQNKIKEKKKKKEKFINEMLTKLFFITKKMDKKNRCRLCDAIL